MNKKIIVPFMVLALAAPLYIAMADESSTTTTGCGSAPTAPGSEATIQERQQYKQNLQQYRQCQQKEAAAAAKEKLLEARCKNIQTRLETRINRYENNGQMFETVFGNMLARMQRLSDRLKAKGIDVSKLEADLITLNGKINKLFSDQESFMLTLEAAKSITCSEVDRENSTETKTKIGEARKVFQTLHEDRLDIRNFFKETIKPDILAIRQQIASQETTTTETEE
jgi:hypothetical protein